MTAGAVSAPLPAVADEFDDGVKFTVGGADQFVVFGALAVGSFVLTIVIPGVFAALQTNNVSSDEEYEDDVRAEGAINRSLRSQSGGRLDGGEDLGYDIERAEY